ncbi:MAG TPA: hypothetical protein VH186_32870 [Chloroflexia bacterium]|nr:hypothetical protein [Chloroflexia bacterium]
MNCPECNKQKISNFDKFSIEKRKMCVDCFNIWIEKPENNPDYKTFRIDARGYTSFEVRALDVDDAQEKAYQYLEDADWDFDVREIK